MSETTTICIVGQGYVGLPLALAFDEEGYEVIGYDISERKIDALSDGFDPSGDHADETIADSSVAFTTDASTIERADYVIITVPTPVDETKNPDLSFVESAAVTVGEHVSEGTTVVLESTVYPGVTRDVLGPVVEEHSGLTVGENLFLGYSPERLSPGDTDLRDAMKIVSGSDEETLDRLVALYGSVVDAGIHRAPTMETAEAAKVTENVQRDINIALVNELAIVCDHMDLDTHAVLEAAGSKWNFHPYRPGLVGGHCIPVDPLYLAHSAERVGYQPKLIMQAREVNEYMPKHTAELALRGLNRCGKVLRDSRVLALGLSYKPNVGDIRTSQVQGVIRALSEYDVEVVGYDPHADKDAMRESFDIDIQDELSFEGFDAVVLATGHDDFSILTLETMAAELDDDPVLVDVVGMFDSDRATEAGFDYSRL
ncbi:nucleotide sugar dehydrogenase [Halocatena marina]|uniref:UDP-N-acetyl-D-mannosamine dehydrogenase n=1 Tax=Halocatena marina TaxID=2934937 RepID=A0ABD5YLS7_9EURY|nr:nucleotide sugar dehydrogenase [Halocatena marina]